MNYEVLEDKIVVNLPGKNISKFRYNKRGSLNEFGHIFATKDIPFDDDAYLEWQIGYDVIVKDAVKKPTRLTNIRFIGDNGFEKHPYELSELLYYSYDIGLISYDEIKNTIDIITGYEDLFEDSYKIELNSFSDFNYNGINFKKGDLILPSIFYETESGVVVEASIRKQQYAGGVQPMVYIAIPIQVFKNYEEMVGKCYPEVSKAVFIIDESNCKFLLDVFKIFGMCSIRHKHDVLEILNAILS